MPAVKMSSLERVLATLGHNEPDRVPLFLLLTTHGAKELKLSIKDYFAKGETVAEGQLLLQEKYGHDCLYSFFYAPVEVEAWGGEVLYFDQGPPNAGAPFITGTSMLNSLTAPDIEHTPCLAKVLEATRLMKKSIGDKSPIIGVVMSPFSLPVMQLGFEAYLEMILHNRAQFDQLMEVNISFSVAWANAQLSAGATAICYFDPLSSPTIIPRELYLQTGFPVAVEALSRINGPTATHLASGRALPIVDDLAQTGTAVVGVSAEEDLAVLKEACRNKLSLLGNLNGIEMIRWNENDAFTAVRKAIRQAAPGGGFILSDNHGEMPYQVPDQVLQAICTAVRQYGQYPIQDGDF